MSHRSYALLALLGIGLIIAVLVVASGQYSLGFSRFFAAEEGAVEVLPSADTPTPVTQPRVEEVVGFCSPSDSQISLGASVTLRSRAATAQWFAPEGSPGDGTGLSFTTSYATAGVKRITVQIPRTDGSSTIDSGACTVVVR